jgi:ADP-heptose:LPS heptosyltransferase
LLTQIRSKQFDYLIDAKDHRSTESGLIARIVKAGKKIGFNPPGKSYFTDGLDGEKDNTGLHFVLRSFKPLSYLGISMPDDIPHPELFPVEESMKYVANFLNGANGKPVLTINLSASNHGKMWENDNWKIFIEAIDKQSFFPIITYAPADSDVATDLLTKVKVAEFNSRNMDDVIALISQSSVLVTPDTSLIHVAAAFDKPLFGLFSGLNDFLAKFHPLSSVYEVVRSPEGIDGIKAISSEQSIEGFNKLIDRLA